MRTKGSPPRGRLCSGTAAAALLTLALVTWAGEEGSDAVRCHSGCRGLGVEKVKAGDEHCGFVPRERKDLALDTACRLADLHREVLESQAEESARTQCGQPMNQAGCRCVAQVRRWENTYTHLLSQRCWTECGWAYELACEAASSAESEGAVSQAGDHSANGGGG